MVEPPSGTVTLMFTDVEGSTQLVQRLGEDYAAALNHVRRVLREAVGGEGGYEVDCRADELFAAFQRAKGALAAAVAVQRSVATFAWPKGARVRLRIGSTPASPSSRAAPTSVWTSAGRPESARPATVGRSS